MLKGGVGSKFVPSEDSRKASLKSSWRPALGGEAFIPFRSNATGRAGGSRLWKKMYHFFMFQHEEFLEHYHKRSNAETVFHMVKAKFGDYVGNKDKTAQIRKTFIEVNCTILR